MTLLLTKTAVVWMVGLVQAKHLMMKSATMSKNITGYVYPRFGETLQRTVIFSPVFEHFNAIIFEELGKRMVKTTRFSRVASMQLVMEMPFTNFVPSPISCLKSVRHFESHVSS